MTVAGMRRRKGRKMGERQYECAISGCACPFNDDVWELGGADSIANDNCPVQSYQNSDRKTESVLYVSDWCRYLIER